MPMNLKGDNMDEKTVNEIVNEVTKKRRRPDSTAQPDPGDNRKYINHSLKLAALKKVDMKNEDEVAQRIQTYFEICAADDMKPSVAGLALALDVDRRYLWEIRVERKGKNPKVADLLKKAVQMLDLQMVDYMQNGKINPVSGIFLMKNNFGYADKQEVEVTAKNPLGDEPDPKAIEEKYVESVVIDKE
jgi:hypothetical protein